MGREEPALVTIGATELRELTDRVTGSSRQQKIQLLLKEDREQRHKLSKARVQNWENTIAGQRRKKLFARAQRIEAEEAERLKVDEEYRKEEENRRKAALERARSLQYFENDLVKTFHNRVHLYKVLEERDAQLVYRAQRRSVEQAHDRKCAQEEEARLLLQFQAEVGAMENIRRANLAVARDQLKQQQEKIDRSQAEIKQSYEERRAIERAAQEELEKIRESQVKKRAKAHSLHTSLEEMIKEVKERALHGKQKEAESERRSQDWVKRKTVQQIKKKQMEQKWFNESMQLREKICDDLAKQQVQVQSNLDEQVERAVRERYAKMDQEEQARQDRKMQQHHELRLGMEEAKRRAEEKIIQKKIAERQALEESIRITEEFLTEEKAKAAALLKERKSLQEFHRDQMAQHQQKRQVEKEEKLKDEKGRLAKLVEEERELMDYVRSLANEPWAQNNARLQRYVEEMEQVNDIAEHATASWETGLGGVGAIATIAGGVGCPNSAVLSAKFAKLQPIANHYHQINSRARLGLGSGSYDDVDLLRNNTIVTGNVLEVAAANTQSGLDGAKNARPSSSISVKSVKSTASND
ncbi:hypothetical protein HK102_000885 [Quaeritorhiza haematococci]|nr:hypothetical protein HK102_000885 [Quaeritorhiza haematococci]